jgi:hypothetical protein
MVLCSKQVLGKCLLNFIENYFYLTKQDEEEKETKTVAPTCPLTQWQCCGGDDITMAPIGREYI